jgi:hypothetical protein
VAWLLRDFGNVQYVTSLEEAKRDQIVLLPAILEEPDLGGAYVGQSFVTERIWSETFLLPSDMIGWWLQRLTRPGQHTDRKVILWLRQDVFDGIPPGERP